jgi:hypothetical protein
VLRGAPGGSARPGPSLALPGWCATVRGQIRQRMPGSCETVAGKRRELDLLITSHDVSIRSCTGMASTHNLVESVHLARLNQAARRRHAPLRSLYEEHCSAQAKHDRTPCGNIPNEGATFMPVHDDPPQVPAATLRSGELRECRHIRGVLVNSA